MNFPRLTFPLTVDFCSTGYWIGDQGPFKYGAAVTAFFIGENIAEVSNDGIPLLRELERQLQTFGGPLSPHVREQPVDTEMFLWPEKDVGNEVQDLLQLLLAHEARCAVGAFAGIDQVACPVILAAVACAHLHDHQDQQRESNDTGADPVQTIWESESGGDTDKEAWIRELGCSAVVQ